MAASTDISPYYDDYNEEKNFHKILFKPGVALQARELTQSQSILQNQIKRIGDYLLTDGEKVSGAKPAINTEARNIRIEDTNVEDINSFIGKFVSSPEQRDIIGQIVAVFDKNDPDIGDPYSIVINLKKADKENDGIFLQSSKLYLYDTYVEAIRGDVSTTVLFIKPDILKNTFASATQFSKEIIFSNPTQLVEVGDIMLHPSLYETRTGIDELQQEFEYQVLAKKIYVTEIRSNLEIVVSEPPGTNISNELVQFVKRGTNPTTIVTQDTSIFYKDGYFVRCPLQTIVPDKNTAYPSKMIGLYSDQEIITSNDDESLLDPALESSNYFAQGADRLRINLTLASISLNDLGKADTQENFIPLVKFNKGEVEYLKETSTDTIIDTKLAQRTYEESGSYIVDNFKILPVETNTNSSKLEFTVSQGLAYVGGARISTPGPTELLIDKNVETETIENYNINTTQGNYFRVANVKHSLISPQQLRAQEIFLETHSVRNPSNVNTRTGIVAFKGLEYDTYDGTTVTYKFFNYYFAQENDAPPDWDLWSSTYNIPVELGQWLSGILYTSGDLLTTGDLIYPGSPIVSTIVTNYYGLKRAPDAAGLAFWCTYYLTTGRDIDITKAAFVYAARQNIVDPPNDSARVLLETKDFIPSTTGGVFYGGFNSTDYIQSFVGVGGDLTGPGQTATYANPFFYADVGPGGIDPITKKLIQFDKKPSDALIFPLAKPFIKNVTKISTEYYKVFKNISFTSGVYTRTFSPPETLAVGDTNSLGPGTSRVNIILLIKSGTSGTTIPLGIWDFESGTVSVSGSSGTLQINLGDASFNGTADIAIKIENDDLAYRTKTLINHEFVQLNIQQADKDYTIGKADIFEYRGVFKLPTVGAFRGRWSDANTYTYNDVVMDKGYMYQATDVTKNVSTSFSNAWSLIKTENLNYYILDDGQRDAIYDHGYVKYIGSTADIPGNVIVSFDFFAHTGEGPAVAASYGENLYSSIPTYRSVFDSTVFNLRDCIDFRPRRQDGTNYQNYDPYIVPTSSINTEATVEYYLGRKDRIYVTNNLKNLDSPYNRFLHVKGVEAYNPSVPNDESDLTKLSIATIDIPPFTVSAFDVKITYDDNKRYTMRDIGKLDDEIVKLGKEIKLQAIEISVLKSIVLDEDENILLKSGIFVDDFSDYNKGDITSGYFSCIIDPTTKECYPTLAAYNIDLQIENDLDIVQNDDLVTLKYEEEVFASQLEANNTTLINPGGIDDLRGRAKLGTKNSLKINAISTGGNLAANTQAIKILEAAIAEETELDDSGQAAYYSAYVGEGVLAAAWKASRDGNLTFFEAVTAIDTITRLITGPTSSLAEISHFIYELIQGGYSTIIPELAVTDQVEDLSLNIANSEFLSGLVKGVQIVNKTLGNILGGNYDYGATGILDGIFRISSSLISETFNDLIDDANRLSRSVAGAPISVIDAIYVAGLPITHADLLPVPPAPRRRRRRRWKIRIRL